MGQPIMISRRQILTLALGASALISAEGAAVSLSQAQLHRVGLRIWQNECAGSVAGLTSWNAGEAFASLGIGHFIWYPKGQRGPFEESFPQLVAFAEARGVKMPAWTKGPCPWSSKAAFEAESGGARQKEHLPQFGIYRRIDYLRSPKKILFLIYGTSIRIRRSTHTCNDGGSGKRNDK